MIFGPLLLIAAPVAAAILTFLTRRFLTLSALVAAIVPLAAAIWAIQTPLRDPLVIFGRTMVLSSADRIAVAYLFTVSAAIFVGVWRASPGWTYYPIALLSLSALAAALIVRPPLNDIYPSFIYSALFVTIAAALAVFPLQGGKPGITGGALRFITSMTLALPALLLADWTLGQFSQSPDTPELARATIVLTVMGFTVLLAIVPFHAWVPAISREAPPLSTVFVLNVLLGAVWFLLLDVINGNRLISGDPRTLEFLRGAGLVMAGFGAVLVWAQRDFGRVLGYGTLADIGVSLFAIGLGSSAGLAAAFMTIITRSIGSGLMAMGLSVAREHKGDDSFTTLTGLAWRLPLTSLAIAAGGLSLAGFPPLAGFAGRWGILQQAATIDIRAAAVMLASGVSVAIGVLRGLREMLKPSTDPDESPPRERRGEAILIIAALVSCVFVGLFPGVFAPIVREFAAAFEFVGK
jgi:formate hydrogenlyase subunit 3/multisubunit Na+/H+ antiporter MnhD subunit